MKDNFKITVIDETYWKYSQLTTKAQESNGMIK